MPPAPCRVSLGAVDRSLLARLARPPLVDVLLAAGLLALAEAEAVFEAVSVPRAVDGLVVLGFTLPLAWRRRAPVAVLVVTVATVLVYGEVELRGAHQTLILALALASFTVGYELPRPRAWLGPAVLAAGLVVAATALGQSTGDMAVAALLYGAPWVFGQVLRNRGEHVRAISARAEEAERDRDRREREAVAAERARIARELHDVVSHSISVVAIQAQAVRRRLGPEQEQEAADLRGIETTARQAMAEMRRLLGVLRAEGERLPLAPQPGLGQLPRLVERARETGLRVELDVEGPAASLSPGVDLAAFRIVQEALTNALKHAAAATVWVRVRYRERHLELTVEDDGRGMSPLPGNGHGLFGMRERVALYGGTCTIGARDGGGFRVQAQLPLHEPEPA
jgi:signal transduction histidine kinase